jgi:hypothetical protein
MCTTPTDWHLAFGDVAQIVCDEVGAPAFDALDTRRLAQAIHGAADEVSTLYLREHLAEDSAFPSK